MISFSDRLEGLLQVVGAEVVLALVALGIYLAGQHLTSPDTGMYSPSSFARGLCNFVAAVLAVPAAVTVAFSPFIILWLIGF